MAARRLLSWLANTSTISKESVFFVGLILDAHHMFQANHAHTVFSLAYGAVLILSHTSLKFYRGHRYVILGANGSGKSTLIRQLRDGKVENPQPPGPVALRCVMVEHSLQGEGTSLSVIDLIVSREPCLFTPESRPIDVFIIS
jgi:hypothetical protein